MVYALKYKPLVFLGVLILLSSCYLLPTFSMPVYMVEGRLGNVKMDTKAGRWLLCEIDLPFLYRDEMLSTTEGIFKMHLSNRIFRLSDSNALLPGDLHLRLSLEQLQDIKNGSDFDFIILLDVRVLRSDLPDYSHSLFDNSAGSKKVRSSLEVYDLNRLQLIYHKQVDGIAGPNSSDSNQAVMTKNVHKLALKTYKKLMHQLANDLEYFD